MTSYPACNTTSLSRKPCIRDKKLIWNTIRKSWTLFQNPSWKISLKRPLAAKSRWRYIRLAIKPRYLGNHAFLIKSYHGTLYRKSWTLFQNPSHEIAWSAYHGLITMTSYPVVNKTNEWMNKWFIGRQQNIQQDTQVPRQNTNTCPEKF